MINLLNLLSGEKYKRLNLFYKKNNKNQDKKEDIKQEDIKQLRFAVNI